MKNILLLLSVLLLPAVPIWAQSAFGRQMQTQVYFPIGKSAVDPDFRDNRRNLDAFVGSLQAVMDNPDYVVSRLTVYGTASPDGTLERNIELAGRRAQALADYIVIRTGVARDKIEVVNNGENWSGLRAMIEASDMPERDHMLYLMDANADRDSRKRAMQYFAGSKPWLYMYAHFFPALRMGAGGTEGHREISALGRDNWRRMREIIVASGLDVEAKQGLLAAIDSEPDASQRMSLLRELCPGDEFGRLQEQAVTGLLGEASALSTDNWTLLRGKIAASDMPSRGEVLRIIDNVPATGGREQQLRALDGGTPYRYLLDRFLPELLVCDRKSRSDTYSGGAQDTLPEGIRDTSTTLSEENWKRLRAMIAVSEMPDREAVLALVDGEPDMRLREQKLRDMNDGRTLQYINEVFFPELLYGLSPASQENWELLRAKVEQSDLPTKTQILEIIRTTAPGADREEAIRLLDEGESWRRMGDLLLPEFLLDTSDVPTTGSGVTFYYELSPAAKARALAMTCRTPVGRRPESPVPAKIPAPAKPVAEAENSTPRAWSPLLAVKTDLVQWAGVTPDFKMATFMPNLALEVYFAERWSVQAGYAYSNWNAFSGDREVYALSAADVEVRSRPGKAPLLRGFYLGVYGTYGQYHVRQAAQGNTGSFWCAGAGAGWLQPLSRHWAVEAELRGGYRSANNTLYDIEPGHDYFNTRQKEGKFTPQVRVHLVYRIGKPQKR